MSMVPASSSDAPVGLEDADETDLVIPRFVIMQKEALFQNSLTKETHSELDVVILGQIKQRVLWPAEVDESNKPLCKSYDHKSGIADEKSFPWAASGFARGDYGEVDPKLPCDDCKLKEWNSHPTRSIPWCTEQWVLPILTDDGAVALLTIQRSGIKTAKDYISHFISTKTPLFTVTTKISLSAQRKGSVEFAVPVFAKTGEVDEAQYGDFGTRLLTIRTFLQTPRSFADEADNPDAPATTSTDAPAGSGDGADASGEVPF